MNLIETVLTSEVRECAVSFKLTQHGLSENYPDLLGGRLIFIWVITVAFSKLNYRILFLFQTVVFGF